MEPVDPVIPLAPEHESYLRDESRFTGFADFIAFPSSLEEVAAVLRWCADQKIAVTVQGSRTGITGGAVPQGGCILNLSGLNRLSEVRYDDRRSEALVRVQPGLLLQDFNNMASGGFLTTAGRKAPPLFFPPDPTEKTASLGGMVACNASGALSFRYGPVRDYVVGLRALLANGECLELRRGRDKAQGRHFRITTREGRVIAGELPQYTLPRVKNAAGYYVADDMDLVDLFVGSEGTLGVVVEAELRLLRLPPVRWGLMAFFRRDEDVPVLVDRLRRRRDQGLAAIEYLDAAALELVRQRRNQVSALDEMPALEPDWRSALYLEIHGRSEGEALDLVEEVAGELQEAGVEESDTWSAEDERRMALLREFRHAVPELVNLRVDELRRAVPGITKLGTDMAVPRERLAEALNMYRQTTAEEKLEAVMFGHIGDNHIHVNILPQDMAAYERGRRLYLQWAEQVVEWGGSISAEHGIGKLKRDLLETMYGAEGVKQMIQLKELFDPECRLGRGTLFSCAQS